MALRLPALRAVITPKHARSIGFLTHSFSCLNGSSRHRTFRTITSSSRINVVDDAKFESSPLPNERERSADLQLCCPICQNPLKGVGSSVSYSLSSFESSKLGCQRCQRQFRVQNGIIDLTISSESSLYEERQLPGTFIFQNPLVAFVYERGWRQGFSFAGFPGVEEEFRLAQKYLEQTRGGILLDVSCGSGLFSRRFLASDDYSTVVASDFSDSMLRQCQDFLKEDRSLDLQKIALVRADVARLPFETGSIAGVHAGAAIHCWPQPSSAVAEISRVLRPGGVFVASTFLLPSVPAVIESVTKPLQQLALQGPFDPYRWWTDAELEDLLRSCGLIDYQREIDRNFIIFSARKPSL